MYFLFSGEGSTDLGSGLSEKLSEGENYLHGPLTLLVDQMIFEKHHYSILESQCCGFISQKRIVEYCKTLKPLKKFRFPRGEIRDSQNTKYFRNNARVLAALANEIACEKKDEVVAILFRDSDCINSAEWQKKFDSMLLGFQDEDFSRGVPMIPKPVSEAWILCALYRRENESRNCNDLENRTHGNDSDHALKIELESLLNAKPDQTLLNQKVEAGEIHFRFINVNGFAKFKILLEKSIR